MENSRSSAKAAPTVKADKPTEQSEVFIKLFFWRQLTLALFIFMSTGLFHRLFLQQKNRQSHNAVLY